MTNGMISLLARCKQRLLLLGLVVCLLLSGFGPAGLRTDKAYAEEPESPAVSIDWTQTVKAIPPLAYGQNSNGFLNVSYTGDADFMAHIRYLNGNKGLVRIHSTSMIDVGGWLNADFTWNESKIVAALTPLAEEAYPVLINIPYGPNGKTDYQDADAFAAFAAELVQIVNVDHGLGIKYWEIPNERESGFASPGLSASAMANLIRTSYIAMKAVDPTIQVGGPATSDANVSYLTSVAQQALPYLDFVTMHAYSSGQSRPATDSAAYNHAQSQGAYITQLRTNLTTIGPQAAALPIFVDEYNMTWDTDPRLHTNKEAVYSALLVANVVGGAGDGVNFWHAENSSMGLMNDARELYDTADLHHWLNLFFHGNQATAVFSDKTKVDGFAVSQGSRKSVLLVNRTASAQPVQLALAGLGAGVWDQYRLDESGSSHSFGLAGSALASAGLTLPPDSVTVLTSAPQAALVERIPYTLTNAESAKLLTATGAVYTYTHEENQLSAAQQWLLEKSGEAFYKLRSRLDGTVLSVTYGTYQTASQWELSALGGKTYALKAAGTELALSAAADPMNPYALLQEDAALPRQSWALTYAGPRTAIIDHSQHLYQIINKASGKALQIGNSRKAEGGIANLQNDEGLASQKWSFRFFEGGSGLRIYNAYSGLVIHAVADARVSQAPFWYDPPRQLWTLEKQVGGDYKIRNNLTGQVLQPQGGSLLEGAIAVTGPDTGAEEQRWLIRKDVREPVAPVVEQDFDFVLQNAATGKVISVAGASTASSATVVQAVYTGSAEQQWRFAWYRSGTRITNKNSGLVLAPNSSLLSIQQTFAYHDVNQQWILEKQPDGAYALIYAANRKVLQPAGGSYADGARLEWADPTGSDVQKWILIRN